MYDFLRAPNNMQLVQGILEENKWAKKSLSYYAQGDARIHPHPSFNGVPKQVDVLTKIDKLKLIMSIKALLIFGPSGSAKSEIALAIASALVRDEPVRNFVYYTSGDLEQVANGNLEQVGALVCDESGSSMKTNVDLHGIDFAKNILEVNIKKPKVLSVNKRHKGYELPTNIYKIVPPIFTWLSRFVFFSSS